MKSEIKLSEIQLPIKKELKYFSKFYKKSVKSAVRIVDTVIKYIISQKGKQVRPTLVLLTAKAIGQVNQSTYRGASLVEILHTATLVHDDVVDEADTRRSFPSINSVWKNKIAVLVGDYLLSTGLTLSVSNNDFDFLRITSRAVEMMSEGEILQIHKSKTFDIDEETYLKIINGKTASLISTCVDIGAKSVTKNKEVLEALHNYGNSVGMAFQIRDDILDYTSRTNILGKPIGGDLREKKITLPLIYALQNSEKNTRSKIISKIRKGVNHADIEEITNFVSERGGLSYAGNKAKNYSISAKKSIEILKNSPSKNSLLNFADFVISRKK